MAIISRCMALLLCCALLPDAASGATMYASIGLRNIGYQLTDLRPDDGAPAAVSFLDREGLMTVSINIPGDGFHHELYPMDRWWSVALGHGNTAALGNVSIDELRVASQLEEIRVPDGYARSELSLDRPFVLAPHSAINWTAQAYGSTRVDAPIGAAMRSHASLTFGLYDGFSVAVGYGAWETGMASGDPAAAFEDNLAFYYANNSDQPIQLVLSAMADSMTMMTPVPEPAMPVLLCCGLLLLAARRRAWLAAHSNVALASSEIEPDPALIVTFVRTV